MAAVCCEVNAVPVAASCSVAIQASLALCFSLVQKREKGRIVPFFFVGTAATKYFHGKSCKRFSLIHYLVPDIRKCFISKNIRLIIMGNKEIVKYFDLEKII